MTIYEIKANIERTNDNSFFFARSTMKCFGQRLRDFSVTQVKRGNNRFFYVEAPVRRNGKINGYTFRLYDAEAKNFVSHVYTRFEAEAVVASILQEAMIKSLPPVVASILQEAKV